MLKFKGDIKGVVNYYDSYRGVSEWRPVCKNEFKGIVAIIMMISDVKDVYIELYDNVDDFIKAYTELDDDTISVDEVMAIDFLSDILLVEE
jgi:hypothetical protein